MKVQIKTVRDKIEAMIDRANELADSENEDTAKRYEQVSESLGAALDALDEALQEFGA